MFPKNILVIFIAFIIARTSVSAADYNITELLKNINYLDNFGDTRIEVSLPHQFRYLPVTKKGCFNVWVKTDNEAQISLSNSPEYKDARIKIIIGGWGNSESAILINDNEKKVRWSTIDILVGKMYEREPFMVYKHEPKLWFPINFAGVTNVHNGEGSWIIKDQHICEFKLS